jgi:hypothetical protein
MDNVQNCDRYMLFHKPLSGISLRFDANILKNFLLQKGGRIYGKSTRIAPGQPVVTSGFM